MATRRERVVLELEDNFTSGMARAAASAALLNKELDSLSHDSVRTQRSFSDIDRSSTSFGRNADKTGAQIDRLSGRLRVLTDVATVIAPAFAPIGALAVPAVSGLASQLGFAAVAGGTAILAFQGIGDALKSLDKAALNPTKKNLDAAHLAMEKLSPAARQFAKEIRGLIPEARRLRDIAASGLFPGVVEGLTQMETALPRVESVISAVSKELGDIAANAGKSLASERWTPFLDFIAREAPQALRDMADAAGNTAHAVAELWMATDPLNDNFSTWLVDATRSLDEWATGLSKTQGFKDFVAYIQDTGPQVADTFAAIGSAVLQIVEAAAPLGGPVLQGIEALAKAIGAIADSDIGTPLFTAAAALALFNRTLAVTTASRNGLVGFQGRMKAAGSSALAFGADVRTVGGDLSFMRSSVLKTGATTVPELVRMNTAASRLKSNLTTVGKGGALLAGLAVASTGAADGMGLTNTASLALMGTIAGPWGAAIGGAAGLMLDAKDAGQGLADALGNVDDVIASNNLDALTAKLRQLKAERADVNNVTGVGDFFSDRAKQIRHAGAFSNNTNKDIDAQIRKVQDAMGGAATTAQQAAQATNTYGRVITGIGSDASSTAGQIDRLIKSMQEQRQEALGAFSAETRYRQALKDARDQAKKSNAGIKGDSDEALKNREAIESLAAAWNGQSDAVKNNTAKFEAAKRNFIETAVAMGVPIRQAERLAKKLLEIPENKVTHMRFNATDALATIRRIKRGLDDIPKKLRTDYYVNQINSTNRPVAPSMERPTFATGGWTGPGSKFQPAGVVHADEFVFSKEATNGNVAYLDALHRQLRGYADGGLVRRSPMVSKPVVVSAGGQVSLSQGDIASLAQAVAAVRPLYGDVKISGDPTTWRRQMEQDRRLAGMGGMPS